MIWRRISEFLMISVLLPVMTVHAEGTETAFQLSLSEPLKGMTYALYEDSSCQKPLENPEGEEIVLVTDASGNAKTSVTAKKFYLKQVQTVPGWYMEKEAITVTDDMLKLEPHPVSYEFSEKTGGKETAAHLQLLDEKKNVIADWKAEKASAPFYRSQKVVLEAGKSYILRDPDVRQWETAGSVTFQIPAYYEKGMIQSAVIERKSFGRVILKTTEPEKKGVSDVSLKLFEDEKGTVQAMDINGKKETLCTSENGTTRADLYPGTYYAQIQDLDSSCYLDSTLYPVHIEPRQTIREEIEVKPVLVSVSMQEPDGKKINGVMKLSGDGKEVKTSGETLRLKRNTSYVLQDISHPSGYHGAQEITFRTPERDQGIKELNLIPEPFQVHGKVSDARTHEIIRKGVFQILDGEGKEVVRFENGQVDTAQLQEGMIYTVHCLSMPSGYQIPVDQKLEIGMSGSPSFEITCIPYVTVSLRTVNENDRQPVKGVKWSLFQDPACTAVLTDIHGREIRNINGSAEVNAGTFYGKIAIDDPHYYPDDQIYEIHAENSDCVLNASLTRADLRILVSDQNQKKVRNIEIDVLNSDGKVIGHMETSGDDLLSSVKLQEEPVPGDILYLEVKKTPGLYTWKDRRTRISIPEKKPAEVPEVHLNLNPYVSLEVYEANEKEKTEGSTYVLYEDENCLHKAMDIHGKETEDTTDREGKIHWDMRSGTYWLKETMTEASAYLNEAPVKVILDPSKTWHEQQNFATVRPVVHFSTVDTQGNPVRGGSYEIQNEAGETVHTFQAGGTVSLKGKWLKPGKTIVIHETSPASGYQKHETDIRYTLPKGIPDQTPEIRIHCLRNAYSGHGKKDNAERMTFMVRRKSGFWLIPCAGIGILTAVIVLKKVSKKHENRFKKN